MATRSLVTLVALFANFVILESRLAAQSTPTAIALSGTAAPAGGNYGAFPASPASIFLPVVNSAGRVEFYSTLAGGSSTAGLFVGSPGSITPIAIQGQVAPAGGNFTDSFSDNQLNAAGQVAFTCTLSSGKQACFVGLPGALQLVALDGTASPGGGEL